MSHFKLVVIRTDGIHYESTFGGWHSEMSAHAVFNDEKTSKRVLVAVLFDGVQSQNSSDIVWTVRTSYSAEIG